MSKVFIFSEKFSRKVFAFYLSNEVAFWFLVANTEVKVVGVSPSGKAAVFGTAIRRFESFHPNMYYP